MGIGFGVVFGVVGGGGVGMEFVLGYVLPVALSAVLRAFVDGDASFLLGVGIRWIVVDECDEMILLVVFLG